MWYDKVFIYKSTEKVLTVMVKKNDTRLLLTVLCWSAALIVLGRVSTQFTSVAATDVAFPEWVSFVSSLLSQLIVCARIVVGYAGMTAAAYTSSADETGKRRYALPGVLTLVLVLSFTDYLARFVIDYASGSIRGAEPLALIWLGLQFLYEGIFIVLSMLIILLQAGKFNASESSRGRERHSPPAAVRCSVLLTLLSRLVLEIVSIIEFVTTYSDITSAETAAMIGGVIQAVVIYGGGALILGEVFTDLMFKEPENAEKT